MAKRSSDEFDNDSTDELPVLLESVALEPSDEASFVTPPHEDTAEHVFYSPADTSVTTEKLAELAARAEQVPSLEAQIRVLTETARDLEQRLAEKDQRLDDLNDRLMALRQATEDAAAVDQQLASQLAVRDTEVADLKQSLERGARDAAAGAAEVQRLRAAAEAAQREAEALRRELAARQAPEAASPDIEKLREDHATLVSYVTSRRSSWDDLQAANAHLAARVTALEHELKSGAKRLATAEAFASRESERAVALRAELVDYARRADALERELKLARALDAQPTVARNAESAPVPAATTKPVPSAAVAASPPETPPVFAEPVEVVPPAVEAIAQLEAEVEYKRQQVAAQLVELRDREQRLRAAMGDLGAARAELDDTRSSIARLERTVADKDRALEARDARIATLHEELRQRLGGIEKRSAVDFPLPPLEAAGVARPGAHDVAESTAAPVLICLTGDAPRRFALTKKTTTVGRGPQCDLQILTHFVSREHARLTSNAGATVIEDLGSRNGVFVNSVRVDRQNLQQGDLVTIGETQFRFVESVAH